MTNTILFFVFLLSALVIGIKLKINIGLVTAIFAFLLGGSLGGLTAGGVVMLFPVSLFYNFLMATFLFGFAGENGTLQKVAEHLIYLCANAKWMLGLLFFAITALIAALGAGGAAPFFMSAICFSLGIQAGINPLLVSVSIWTATMAGSSFAWTSGYASNVGQLEIYFEKSAAVGYVMDFFVFRAIFYTILFLITYLILKGYRVKSTDLHIHKPECFDRFQKITLAIILGIIALLVIPPLAQLIAPSKLMELIGTNASFQLLAAVGIVLNIFFKTAPYEKVLKNRIPWDLLIMLCFMGMYMALAKPMGVVDYMSQLLQNSIPSWLLLPGIVLIMGVLSFFVSGGAVIPMMLPLLPALSSAAGVSVSMVYCAAQMGLTASSISPFSQGGAAVLTGCPNEKIRGRLLKQQTILAAIFTLVLAVVAALGGFSWLES